MSRPAVTQSLKELKEVPDLARIIKLSGINFPDAITHYNRAGNQDKAGTRGPGAMTVDHCAHPRVHNDPPSRETRPTLRWAG